MHLFVQCTNIHYTQGMETKPILISILVDTENVIYIQNKILLCLKKRKSCNLC